MVSHFVVPSLTMKIFHVHPKKYPLKTEIGFKTFLKKNPLNKNNLFSIKKNNTKLIIITTTGPQLWEIYTYIIK